MNEIILDALVQAFEGNNVLKEYIDVCDRCDGSGVVLIPNGKDDYEKDFCECEIGRAESKEWSSEE